MRNFLKEIKSFYKTQIFKSLYLCNLWPNLKNLSGGLNLSRGLNMVVPLKIVSNVSRSKPALNLKRGLADLNRGSNSLNSISDRKPLVFQTSIILSDRILSVKYRRFAKI